MRFNTKLDSSQSDEVTNYLERRYYQIAALGRNVCDPLIIKKEDMQILFLRYSYYEDSQNYAAVYLYKDFRVKGKYRKILESLNRAGYDIITVNDCNLDKYFKHIKISYECINICPEYSVISKYYEDKYAKRTGLHYMNHIDEGCILIDDLTDKQAFMLHPIFQNGDENKVDLSKCNKNAIKLAKKYAIAANSYLPKDYKSDAPIPDLDLQQMLIADKIQNYKDFCENRSVFPEEKAAQLEIYFNKWFQALMIHKNYKDSLIYSISNKVTVI